MSWKNLGLPVSVEETESAEEMEKRWARKLRANWTISVVEARSRDFEEGEVIQVRWCEEARSVERLENAI